MLTSLRKLQKLFIKFIEWGQLAKAEAIIRNNPDLEIPWQKAFVSAVMNNMERSARWVIENISKYPLTVQRFLK
jgi:hypothetical protein